MLNMKVERGFSLVEMAVVLVILGFVITALILPVSAQREAGFLRQTDDQLEVAQKALIGFAQTYGRLPCPASAVGNDDPGSRGVAQPIEGGQCADINGANTIAIGYLPAATLGLAQVDQYGFAIDGWGNRIRYALTQSPSVSNPVIMTPFSITNGMISARMGNLVPNLQVLNGVGGTALISNAVAVIYSTGKDLNVGGIDEAANLDEDHVFISHDIQANGLNGEFDHRVVWISPYVLYNAMIQAGQLP